MASKLLDALLSAGGYNTLQNPDAVGLGVARYMQQKNQPLLRVGDAVPSPFNAEALKSAAGLNTLRNLPRSGPGPNPMDAMAPSDVRDRLSKVGSRPAAPSGKEMAEIDAAADRVLSDPQFADFIRGILEMPSVDPNDPRVQKAAAILKRANQKANQKPADLRAQVKGMERPGATRPQVPDVQLPEMGDPMKALIGTGKYPFGPAEGPSKPKVDDMGKALVQDELENNPSKAVPFPQMPLPARILDAAMGANKQFAQGATNVLNSVFGELPPTPRNLTEALTGDLAQDPDGIPPPDPEDMQTGEEKTTKPTPTKKEQVKYVSGGGLNKPLRAHETIMKALSQYDGLDKVADSVKTTAKQDVAAEHGQAISKKEAKKLPDWVIPTAYAAAAILGSNSPHLSQAVGAGGKAFLDAHMALKSAEKAGAVKQQELAIKARNAAAYEKTAEAQMTSAKAKKKRTKEIENFEYFAKLYGPGEARDMLFANKPMRDILKAVVEGQMDPMSLMIGDGKNDPRVQNVIKALEQINPRLAARMRAATGGTKAEVKAGIQRYNPALK